MLNQKGYVGSIGDDLPSLIPITFALLVFFAAIGFAFNAFDEKQTDFDQKLVKLKIGTTLAGEGFIDNYLEWNNSCESLSVTAFKFRAVVFLHADPATNQFQNVQVFEDQSLPSGSSYASVLQDATTRNKFECTNANGQLPRFTSLSSQQPEQLLYPMAINQPEGVVAGMLLVSVWR